MPLAEPSATQLRPGGLSPDLIGSAAVQGSVPIKTTALCVLGAWRSFDLAAPSIQQYAIKPLNAQAFARIEREVSNPAVQTWQRCKEILGDDAECLVGERSDIIDEVLFSQFNTSSISTCINTRGNKVPQPVLPLLQIHSCWRAVTEFGESRGLPFSVIGRMRTDMLLFERLPPYFLQQFAPYEGALVAGDQWGTYPDNKTSVSDNLLVAGTAVMEADANAWRHILAGETEFCGIAEKRQRQTLREYLPSVAPIPLAYCKLTSDGACRYLGELRQSTKRISLTRLLSMHEKACDRVLSRGECDPHREQGDCDFPQTLLDYGEDPNFCKLQQACQKETMIMGHVVDVVKVSDDPEDVLHASHDSANETAKQRQRHMLRGLGRYPNARSR